MDTLKNAFGLTKMKTNRPLLYFFSDAIKTVNNRADVRCILDGPDFTPWWVKTDVASCKGKDINRLEQEHFLWGKVADQSCVKASAGNTSEIFHQCGVFSRLV